VLNSFQVKFPNADDVKWKLNHGEYEVKCKVNHKANEIKMDFKGRVLRHQQDLYVSEIPKSVLSTIRSKVAFFDVNDADRIEENGKTTYVIKFENDHREQVFWIDDKGKLIKYRKELRNSEVPASIIRFIENGYGEIDIDRAKYIEENGEKFYLVVGEINDSDHAFWIDNKVNLLEHHEDLKSSEIPASILNSVHESYNDYDIRDADLIERRGVITYILRLKKSHKNKYITFNPQGKVLSVK
jgi:uncharacterized membrane protein YkoI